MDLNPGGQDCNAPPRCLVWRLVSLPEFLSLVKAETSEEVAVPCAFLPCCRLHPCPAARTPGRLLARPPFLPPPLLPSPEPTQVSPLPRSATAHDFRFFFLVHSQQPEVRLNHSRICSCECVLPPPEKKDTLVVILTFPLDPRWGEPGLGYGDSTK